MDNSSSHSGNLNKHPRKSYLAFEQNEKRYKCTICLQEFSSERLLRDHEHDHVTPFCHICSKMFKSAKLLRVHHQSYHSSSSSQQSPPHASSKSKETFNDDNICHDLTLHKIKEEPIDIVSEPEIENLLNHDSHHLSSPHHSDYYPEPSKSSLGIWRNFTETPTSAFLDHSSVPLPLGIKMEPVDSEHDQFDFIINEILKKPPGDGSSSSSRLSLVAEEISMHQNFWTQSDHQQDTWICDICSKTFTTKQILQRHRIATHDQNKDFKCDQCDQWFSSTNNHELIKHVNEVHNGFKKFICDFQGCHKEFSRRDALKRHRTCHEKGNRSTSQIHHSSNQPYFRPHLTRH